MDKWLECCRQAQTQCHMTYTYIAEWYEAHRIFFLTQSSVLGVSMLPWDSHSSIALAAVRLKLSLGICREVYRIHISLYQYLLPRCTHYYIVLISWSTLNYNVAVLVLIRVTAHSVVVGQVHIVIMAQPCLTSCTSLDPKCIHQLICMVYSNLYFLSLTTIACFKCQWQYYVFAYEHINLAPFLIPFPSQKWAGSRDWGSIRACP